MDIFRGIVNRDGKEGNVENLMRFGDDRIEGRVVVRGRDVKLEIAGGGISVFTWEGGIKRVILSPFENALHLREAVYRPTHLRWNYFPLV